MSTRIALRVLCAAAAVWATSAGAQQTSKTYGPTRTDYSVSLDRMFAAGEHFRLAPEPLRSYTDARKWYEMAANAGDRRSMALLGWLYRTANGVEQNDAKARHWYARAYDEGYRDAWLQYGLGLLTLHGRGGARDEVAGHTFMVAAAALGYAPAMYHVAWNFEEGRGVRTDYERARRWYEVAASAGNPEAMTRLAHIYHKGRGVKQDLGEARRWYDRAAAAGQSDAMYNLGVMAESGEGMRRDTASAAGWYAKAAAIGHAEAGAALGALGYAKAAVAPAKPRLGDRTAAVTAKPGGA